MTLVQYEVIQLLFFSISLLLSKTKTPIFEKNVLSKLLKVTISVSVMSKFTIKGFAPKDATWKSEFFAYVISCRQSTNQQKKLLRNNAFHVKISPSVRN